MSATRRRSSRRRDGRLDDGKQASPHITTTDASGFYSFAGVLKGTYTASAWGGGCVGTETLEVEGAGADDAELHPCRAHGRVRLLLRAGSGTRSQEAANVLTLAGDDVAVAVTLPFPFQFYGAGPTRRPL